MIRAALTRTIVTFCAVAALAGTMAGPALAAQATGHPAGDPFAHLTADQVVARAAADIAHLRSVHVWGKIQLHATYKLGGRVQTVNMTTIVNETYTPQGCLLKVTTADSPLSESVLIIGGRAWLQPDDSFWKALGYSGSQLAAVSGKWIQAPANDGGPLCSIRQFASGPGRGWHRGWLSRHHGVTALALTQGQRKNRVTMEVSVAARPLILSIVAPVRIQLSTTSTTTVTATSVRPADPPQPQTQITGTAAEYFGNFDAPVTLSPPPPADVLTQIPVPSGQAAADRLAATALRSLRVYGLVAG